MSLAIISHRNKVIKSCQSVANLNFYINQCVLTEQFLSRRVIFVFHLLHSLFVLFRLISRFRASAINTHWKRMFTQLMKGCLMLLSSAPNIFIFKKIFSRPPTHNAFNVSLACRFLFLGMIGPLLVLSYFHIHENINQRQALNMDGLKKDCANFIDVRNMALLAEQIVGQNLVFRFFYIVHADKGFVVKGIYNTKIFNLCFVLLTCTYTMYTYLPYFIASSLKDEYPDNTVKGRICLGHRLNWDLKDTKNTLNVYIKPRVMIITFVMISVFFNCYLCGYKARQFIKQFCPNQQTFASIGGPYRRNILTHKELFVCHVFVLIHVFLDNVFIFFFYFCQDIVGYQNVFNLHVIWCAIADVFMIIVLPSLTILKCLEDYPELWIPVDIKPAPFYMSSFKMIPRPDPSEAIWRKDCRLKSLQKRNLRVPKKRPHRLQMLRVFPVIFEESEEKLKNLKRKDHSDSLMPTMPDVDIV